MKNFEGGRMKKFGICKLCGEFKKLTFEHIPPEGAFNSSPVLFQDKENFLDKSSYRYGGRKRSNRGAGGYHLCGPCNNNTGSWYANDYINFVKQGAYVLTHRVYANNFICAEYEIKPLNVLKQILTMFVALDNSGFYLKRPSIREFILDTKSKSLPPGIRVLMYMSSAINLRNPLSWSNMDGYMRTFGEITFVPFGFHISIDSPVIDRPFCDISNFSDFEFNEESLITVPLRHLIPQSILPGLYL